MRTLITYRIQPILLLLPLAFLTVAHPRSLTQQPNTTDLNDVVITMETDCSHSFCPSPVEAENAISCCPKYSVSISGDGTVIYEGISGVEVRGKRTYSIPAERVRELVEEFARANFFSMEERYRFKKLNRGRMESISHGIAKIVSIRVGSRTKSVYNFYGGPEALEQLQRKIYEFSQVGQFVGRT